MVGDIDIKTSMLFICDIQKVFRYRICNFEKLVRNCAYLIEIAKILEIPLILSEQIPESLGETIEEILRILPKKTSIIRKGKFSMITNQLLSKLKNQNIKSVILLGIETHICILQTALELKKNNIDVHIILEGVSSQKISDTKISLQRMQQSGIFVTSFESLVFQLLKTSNHSKFKKIINIIKIKSKEDTELND